MDLFAFSKDNKFNNLEAGTIVTTRAKRLVKKSRYNEVDKIIL